MTKNAHDSSLHTHDHEAHDDHTHYGLPLFLVLVFAFVETWGGWWTHSLALLSDAWHMFTDVISLALAWLGATLATKPNVKRHTSGMSYPELWASSVNAVLMMVVIIWIVIEAIDRLQNPPKVAGGVVFWIAILGLIVNLIVAKQLHHQAHEHGENLNNRAAYLHVLGDLLGSLAAIAAGAIIYYTGWVQIDPILSILISLVLAVMTAKLIFSILKTLSLSQSHHHEHHDH